MPPVGITLAGFKQLLTKQVPLGKNYKKIHKWLDSLGYLEDLYQIRSRAFNLSIHSTKPISVQMKDALQTDLDFVASQLIISQFG